MHSPILTSIVPILPLHVDLAEMCMQLVVRALELLGVTPMTEWLVYKDPTHKKQYVFFDRFRFDLCSMLTEQIVNQQLDTVLFEVILRQIYAAVTYYDVSNAIRIRSYKDIELQLDVVTAHDSESSSSSSAESPRATIEITSRDNLPGVFGRNLKSPGSAAETAKHDLPEYETDEELDPLLHEVEGMGERVNTLQTRKESLSWVEE